MSYPILRSVSLKNGVLAFRVEPAPRTNPVRRNPGVSKAERDAVMAAMYARYSKKGIGLSRQEREDNASVAAIAVDAAAKNYDPALTSLPFEKYVVVKIEQALAEARRKTGGGRDQAEAGKELAVYVRMYRQLRPTGSPPTEAQLADVSGKSLAYIQELRRRAHEGRAISTSAGVAGVDSEGEEGEATVGDMLASATVEEVQEAAAARAEVRKKSLQAPELTEEERYFVGWHTKGLNIRQIADRMHMSYTKARGLAKKLAPHLLTGGAA